MSAEVIARLREKLNVMQARKYHRFVVEVADLRALLDAHAEALDALSELEDGCASVASWSDACLDFSDSRRVAVRAVLAKAGRR